MGTHVDFIRRSPVHMQVLDRVQNSYPKAASEILPLLYDELHKLAVHKMANEPAGHTLQPTALVHEAWLRLARVENQAWASRAQFFAAAAEAMRRILVETARRKARFKRGGGQEHIDIHSLDLADTSADEKVLLIDEAIERLKAESPEKARIVVLKFFAGMTSTEIAAQLGISERTVERQWAYAKAWLFQAIRQHGLSSPL
jgi:RNA polymerase sigma factor (TIGR02999 family)